jgi:hypothetical protein
MPPHPGLFVCSTSKAFTLKNPVPGHPRTGTENAKKPPKTDNKTLTASPRIN